MDRFNPDTSNNDTPQGVEEQVPHSGVYHGEKPVKDFDNTNLAEAVDQGLITVPDNVSLIEANPADVPPIVPPTYTTEQSSSKPERKKPGLGTKIGVGAAALVVGVGGYFGVQAVNAGNNTPPEKNPDDNSQVEEEPGTDNETKPNTNEIPASIAEVINNPKRVTAEQIAAMSPEELKEFTTITVEEAPTPEALAEQYITILDSFYSAGRTIEEVTPFLNEGAGVYENAMINKYETAYNENLYTNISIDGLTKGHELALNAYLMSIYGVDEPKPYDIALKYEGMEIVDDKQPLMTVLDINYRIADNIEQSTASDVIKRKNTDETRTQRVTFVELGGAYHITDAQTQ